MLQPLRKGYITAGSDATSHENMEAHDYGWNSLNIIDPELIAIDDGKIVYSGKMVGAGYSTILEVLSANPKYKYLGRYVHNKKNLYPVGTKVKRGQPLAIGGKSGNASGEHVHFELWMVGIDFDFTAQPYGATRAKYTVDPKDFINYENFYFSKYYKNKKFPLENYIETPLYDTKAVTESKSLNMRDYPTTKSFSAGAMPKELKAIAKTSKVRGYEWIKCEYNGHHVYVASNWVKLVGACEPVIIEKEVIKEVVKEVFVQVEYPFKETFEKDGLIVTVEKKVSK